MLLSSADALKISVLHMKVFHDNWIVAAPSEFCWAEVF
jgi:hypothetical protein